MQHLSEHPLPGLNDGEKDLLYNVETNTKQYLKLFAEAADDCLGQIAPTVRHTPDVYDVLLQQVTDRRGQKDPRRHRWAGRSSAMWKVAKEGPMGQA